ncbi:MAG TPA: PmoA family protein, partial [Pirellulaceae bacterium]|nr:PmoA family protein [Pirellulaceae bacterium]
RIVFDSAERKKYAYRVDGPPAAKVQNVTTLDDNTTQAALSFLMRLDEELQQRDAELHEAIVYALDHLLAAQYPNGAWPQRFSQPPQADAFPVLRASFPEKWSRTYEGKDYRGHYTLNDSTQADMIRTLFLAYDIYGDEKYRAAAARGGDFLLLAQLPEPQPGWAQQYDAQMHPAWARKFEPPSVTGGESQGAMQALIEVYLRTGDAKYVESLPRAIAYFRRSQLADGRLARFYEIGANRPLFFTKKYELTYDDGDMPTHYAFKISSSLNSIERSLRDANNQVAARKKQGGELTERRGPQTRRFQPDAVKANRESGRRAAASALAKLDSRGAWVDKGRLHYHGDDDPAREVIESTTFSRNALALGYFLAATRDDAGAAGDQAKNEQLAVPLAAAASSPMSLKVGAKELEIVAGKQVIGRYVLSDEKTKRPYLKDVKTAGGIQVTRNHPPQAAAGDPIDHDALHPGIWLGFGDIAGRDYWRNKAVVRSRGLEGEPFSGPGFLTFAIANSYLGDGDEELVRETCSISVNEVSGGFLWIIASYFVAQQDGLYFGDQEEMGLGIRVATPIMVKSGGRLLNSEGRVNEKEVWGRQADWCDYSGRVGESRVGVTVMPDPANFRRSWMHARDYGLLAANPFGQNAFTKDDKSRIPIPRDKPLRLRYGIYVHSSPTAGPEVDFKSTYAQYKQLLEAAGK